MLGQPSQPESGNLRLFYEKIFPCHKLLDWLSGDASTKSRAISRREFSFTLPGGIYTRFLSFASAEEFASRLASQAPVKIDIGAVYNARPNERKSLGSNQFRPLEKELVFDIDMTDYDDVRNCCTDKKICRKCWKFISVAVKIIDQCLQDDFGFEHRMWVFSGRRGIHCWVSDERARKLSPAARKSIVSFIDLKKGGNEMKKKISLHATDLHPSLERSLSIVKSHFSDIVLNDQDFLNVERTRDYFLSFLPESLKSQVLKKWSHDSEALSSEKWSDFQEAFESAIAGQKNNTSMSSLEIQTFILYPRLDINVSMQLNHLLKSPFCIHPDTGKICVPLKPTEVDAFDPNECPTLFDVTNEFASCGDVYKTSLGPYLTFFDEHINSLQQSYEHRGPSLDF